MDSVETFVSLKLRLPYQSPSSRSGSKQAQLQLKPTAYNPSWPSPWQLVGSRGEQQVDVVVLTLQGPNVQAQWPQLASVHPPLW
mmetsp:Transcript_51209/g.52167  ORF Transcript_51209/g.52167 Transcript_51209/m.52167 type:complete len:84 (+) Transcript_51209:235-486(+)